MQIKSLALGTALMTTLAAAPVMASTMSTSAVTDLNMRVGPGPMYAIADVIPAEGVVSVEGCLQTADWCKVTHGEASGWAYSRYLQLEGETVAMLDNTPDTVTVTHIEHDATEQAEAGFVGGAAGAAIGTLIAGPAGGIVGGLLTGGAMASTVPVETTVYVTEHPVEPVILDGEVVVGAAIPQGVVVYEVPQSEQYAYLNVNCDQVLVEKDTRKIVKVVR